MIKKLLITAVLATCAMSAYAEPAPVLPPSPTVPTPTPTQIGIVGNDVIRPTSSANAETYKKVPIDKGKIGGYLKKMPKGGFLELGLIVGITALSEAVDYLIDEAGTVRYTNYTWFVFKDGVEQTFTSLPDACRAWIAVNNMPYIYTKSTVSMIQTVYGYAVPLGNCFYQSTNGGGGYFNVNAKRDSKKDSEIPLDELADRVIDGAKKGNPTAVRVINDWADDEIRRNPDAYPDVVPQPQPQPQPSPDPLPQPDPNPKPNPVPQPSPDPVGDPKTNPSPNPNAPPSGNPATNPNPADNPSGTPNTQPDPATSPNDGTNPNEQTFNFELPAFCSWATIVCEFIGTKPDMPDEPLPTKDVPLKTPAEFDKDYIDFGGQCPADINVDIDLAFAKHTIIYSFTPICDFVQNYLRIVIIIGAYIFATIHISSAFKI